MSFRHSHAYTYRSLSGSVSLTALQLAQSHFVKSGGGYHDGLLLNIDDLTANFVGRDGDTAVSDASALGLRLDVRQASGSMQSLIDAQPKLTPNILGQNGTNFITDLGDNTYRFHGDGSSYTYVRFITGFTAGARYYIKPEVIARVDGALKATHNAVDSSLYGAFTATPEPLRAECETKVEFGRASGGQPIDITVKFTVQEIPGNHMVAAADDERGTYTIDVNGVAGNTLDGVNDGHQTIGDIGVTETVFDMMLELETDTTQFMWFSASTASRYVGASQDGNTGSPTEDSSGSPTYFVDAIEVTGANRDVLDALVRDKGPTLVEVRDVNITTWLDVGISAFGSWLVNGIARNAAIYPSSQRSDAQVKDHRNYLLGQAGQPLIGDSVYNIFDAAKVETAAVGSFNDLTDDSSLFIGRNGGGSQGNAAIGDAVGFVVDKSIIGSQSLDAFIAAADALVDDASASQWTPGGTNLIEDDGDEVKFTYVDNSTGGTLLLTQAAGTLESDLEVGEWYELAFTARVNTGGQAFRLYSGSETVQTGVIANTTEQTFRYIFKYTAGQPFLRAQSMQAGEIQWLKLLRVVKLPGIHWHAEADDERPTLQQTDAEVRYLDFDGVNDRLVATDTLTLIDTVQALNWDSAAGVSVGSNTITNYESVLRSGGLTYLADDNTAKSYADTTTGDDEILSSRFGAEGFVRKDKTVRVTGNFGAVPADVGLQLGARNPSPFTFFNGRMYAAPLLSNRQLHGVELYNAEQHFEDLLTPPVHKLFNDGAGGIREGGLFDADDLTSMYDGSGNGVASNPAIGDSVGVWLDKKFMGGQTAAAYIATQPELVTDGFSTPTGVSQAGTVFTFDNVGLFDISSKNILTSGKYYVATISISGLGAGKDIRFFGGTSGGSPNTNNLQNGDFEFPFRASGAAFGIRAQDADVSCTITVSVKEVEGDHLVAAADDERPMLTTDGVTSDGVNDALVWAANPFSTATAATALVRGRADDAGVINSAFFSGFSSDANHTYQPNGSTFQENFGTIGRFSLGSSGADHKEFFDYKVNLDADLSAYVNGTLLGTQAGVTISWSTTTAALFRSRESSPLFASRTIKRLVFIDYVLADYEEKSAETWIKANG